VKARSVFTVHCLIFCGLVLALGGCDAGTGKEDSPEKVFVVYCTAMKVNDFAKASRYITAESSDFVVQFFVRDGICDAYLARDVGLSVDETYLKRLKEVLRKHDISDETVDKLTKEKDTDEALRKFVPMIKDRYAFIRDMAEIKDRRAPGVKWEDSKLQNVTIKETTAKGTMLLTVNGERQTTPIVFRKQEGNWRIDFLAEPSTPSSLFVKK
jgi:hypothetical protein